MIFLDVIGKMACISELQDVDYEGQMPKQILLDIEDKQYDPSVYIPVVNSQ